MSNEDGRVAEARMWLRHQAAEPLSTTGVNARAALGELDRLRAVETAAAAYVMAGLCGNPNPSAELLALIDAVRTNPAFLG